MTNMTYMAMSENQYGLWLLQTVNPGLKSYNIAAVFRVLSILDIAALKCALNRVTYHHPILRTTFVLRNESPVQCIHTELAPQFEEIDVTDSSAEALQNRVQAAHDRPFDLAAGPLVRMTVFHCAVDEHIILFNCHHILLDFRSLGKITQEILQTYQRETGLAETCLVETQKQASSLPRTPEIADYAEFATWQQNFLTGEKGKEQQQYWRKQLQAPLPLLNLLTDHPYPAQQTYNGGSLPICLPATLSQRIFAAAEQKRVTTFMFLLAAYTLLIARYSHQTDLIIGIASSERLQAPQRFRQTIGHFVNLLPMRFTIAPDTSLNDLLYQTQTVVMGGLFHQNYPFARMVKDLQMERDLSRPPLIEASFNMPVLDTDAAFIPFVFGSPDNGLGTILYHGLQLAPYPLRQQEAQVSLDLNIWQQGEQLVGYFKYNTDLFDESTIARLARHFEVLLHSIVTHPDQPLLQLPMLTATEYQQIVHDWNDTTVDFGEPQTIQALFEQQVARTPDAVAVVMAEDKETRRQGDRESSSRPLARSPSSCLTYAELNARANQLAHHLMALGVGNPLGADTLVAVMMDRSLEMVVSLLAVLKAGGAYVPIDPAYPTERIAYMLTDSAAPILLTQAHLSSHLAVDHATHHVVAVDTIGTQLAAQPLHNPQTQTSPAHLAYVIYTSGSTGRPKGIQITQGNATNFLMAMQQQPGLMREDRLLALTTISFDIAVLELYLPLVVGASVVIASQDDITDPDALIRLIQQYKITVAQATPVTWTMLTAHKEWSATVPLKVLCGGEALPLRLAQQLLEHSQGVWNLYGPTEATVWVSVGQLQKGLRRVTIAPPIANSTFYILGDGGQVVPLGVSGELYIGGSQLARGYLNRPELTAERFIDHPVFGRLYKTGDLCRWLPAPNGHPNIEYLGRTDFQVKIRGFRIELGEIESVLLSHAGVREAVVLAREDTPGDKRLVAYVVLDQETFADGISPDPGLPRSWSILRRSLQEKLPDYMIPAAFVILESLPLTPNGKMDHRALPAPASLRCTTDEHFVAPDSATERILANIWSEVLGHSDISKHDDFFKIGGHSLLATRIISRIRQSVAIDLPLRQIFETPTIATLANTIDDYVATRHLLKNRPATVGSIRTAATLTKGRI